MDGLPNELRTAIVLREIEGLSYEEIAENHELSDRHGALTDFPCSRGGRGKAAPLA
jgi:hypothetical protein